MTDETRKNEAADAAETNARPQGPPSPGAANGNGPALGQGAGEMAQAPQPTPAEELAETRDRLLRTLADMENLRRRTARELDEARRYAVTGFARGLLEVADNLSRALASVPPEMRDRDEFIKNLVAGIELTERSLMALFEKHEIRKVDPARGDRFDHNVQQAMFEVPTSELPAGSVAEVLQPGYVIADRLLRPAMVGVAKAPPGPAPAEASGEGPGEGGPRIDTLA
jgi:molecular chaperone GrpE